MTARLANLAEVAAMCLRSLARDLDLASARPSTQAESTVAESRREARAALADLGDARPSEAPTARVQRGMVERGGVWDLSLVRWAEQWDAWALTVDAAEVDFAIRADLDALNLEPAPLPEQGPGQFALPQK